MVVNLIDTLDANREKCVGMAANMIGGAVTTFIKSYLLDTKRIIIFSEDVKILGEDACDRCPLAI